MRISASFLALSLAFTAGISLTGVAKADSITIGNPAIASSQTDGDPADGYILPTAFGVSGYTVTSYSFYANSVASITPILFTAVSSGGYTTFTVVGIGATQTSTDGLNTDTFGPFTGTDITTANTYFGFENSNGGNVGFEYATTPGTFLLAYTLGQTPLSLGSQVSDENTTEIVNAPGNFTNRDYAINATAVSATPEPNSLILLGTGLLGVCGLARRRFSKV